MIIAASKRREMILFWRSGYGTLRPACGNKIMQYSSVGSEEPRGYRRARLRTDGAPVVPLLDASRG